MEEDLSYTVVIFTSNGEEYVSAAPKKWLRNEEENMVLMWPGNKAVERKAIKLNMTPERDWIKYENIKIVGYYATLKEALDVEKQKQNSSCSETEIRKKGKRKIRNNKKYRDDSISPPPQMEEIVIEHDDTNQPYNQESIESYKFPTASDIINANGILLDKNTTVNDNQDAMNTVDEILVIEEHSTVTSKPKKAEILTTQTNTTSTLDTEHNINVSPSDTDSISAAGASSISGNSSIDELVVEIKIIKSFVTYTMRKMESIELYLKRLDFPSEPKKTALPNLPLKEIVQLKALEDSLEDESVRNELFDMLRHTGGTKERDCVNRCLEKNFTNYLGQFCSGTGKKNNHKLASLNLMTIIKRAVKVTFPNMTDESYERHVMNWFQHSATGLKREN